MPLTIADDPSPVTPAQLWALLSSATRELTWGLEATSREVRQWRALAERIPSGQLREDALHALDSKRGHADGAALCSILPQRRSAALVRAVVAYQTILDYLDNVSERHPTFDNGQQLHRALVDAVSPEAAVADYYRFHPWRDDGGYLNALIEACRTSCRALPSYTRVQVAVIEEARLSAVLGLNHELDAQRRDAELRSWAARTFTEAHGLQWFELTAAASASLLVHVLLSLAADDTLADAEVTQVRAAHWPWIALAATMLDSYADWAADLASGSHSYVEHYENAELAVLRVGESTAIAMRRAIALPNGRRHAVIVGCMVALYLSQDAARVPAVRAATSDIARNGGSLVRMLLPILRAWRLVNGQRT